MSTIAKMFLLAGIVCLISSGEASARKANCYKHHACTKNHPEDIYKKSPMNEGQCRDGGGLAWGTGPFDCKTF